MCSKQARFLLRRIHDAVFVSDRPDRSRRRGSATTGCWMLAVTEVRPLAVRRSSSGATARLVRKGKSHASTVTLIGVEQLGSARDTTASRETRLCVRTRMWSTTSRALPCADRKTLALVGDGRDLTGSARGDEQGRHGRVVRVPLPLVFGIGRGAGCFPIVFGATASAVRLLAASRFSASRPCMIARVPSCEPRFSDLFGHIRALSCLLLL